MGKRKRRRERGDGAGGERERGGVCLSVGLSVCLSCVSSVVLTFVIGGKKKAHIPTLKEMIESSKFRSDSAIRKKPLKFKNVRQIYTDLSNPYMANELKLKIGSSLKFDCSKDPDVIRAADLLMELSSSASSASSNLPVWSDEMYPWPQPEVVRLKMRGMPEICVS